MITVNKIAVLNFNLMLQLNGVWQTGTLVLDTADASQFKAGQSINIVDDAGLTFTGTIVPERVGLSVETLHLRVIGGANGMDIQPAPKQFNRALLRDIISHITNSSGETLSTDVDQGLLTGYIGTWTVFAATCAIALNQILNFVDPNINWRILPDGTLWFGYDTYPDLTDNTAVNTSPNNPTEQMGSFHMEHLSIPAGVTFINNGETVGKVARVQYQVKDGAVKVVIWNDIGALTGRGIAPALEDAVVALTDRFRFLGTYVGTVVSQSSDWTTVQVQSADSNVPNMVDIPLLTGQYWKIVGEKVKYGWFAGDPSQPYAEPFIAANNPQYVALSNLVTNNLNAIKNGLDTHIHLAGGYSAPPAGGPVTGVSGAATPDGYYSVTSVAATKVKAE